MSLQYANDILDYRLVSDSSDAVKEGYYLDMNILNGAFCSASSGTGGGRGDCGDHATRAGEAPKVWRGMYTGDPRGEVVIDICDNYEFGEYRTKVVYLEIRLKKSFLNKWFGTKY